MSITNHLLAGSLIAIAVSNPILAVPLAFGSHFVMDALPHFGYPETKGFYEAVKGAWKHKLARVYTYTSAITFLITALWLLYTGNYYPLIIGLVAVSPDAIMALNYILLERNGKNLDNVFTKVNINFHGKIQFERPWGIWVEVVIFIVLTLIISRK